MRRLFRNLTPIEIGLLVAIVIVASLEVIKGMQPDSQPQIANDEIIVVPDDGPPSSLT